MNSEKQRERLCGTEIRPRKLSTCFREDPTKALAVKYFERLVARGLAEWDTPKNGDIHLRFCTGEIFLLADTFIVRLA